MINANELRIGNWIKSLGWDEDAGGNIVGDPEGDENVCVDVELIKWISDPPKGTITQYRGIPLTPEIIMRLIQSDDSKIELIGGWGFSIKGINFNYGDAECKLRLMANDAGESFEPDVLVTSVHRLQNLIFTLTGTELEINLT